MKHIAPTDAPRGLSREDLDAIACGELKETVYAQIAGELSQARQDLEALEEIPLRAMALTISAGDIQHAIDQIDRQAAMFQELDRREGGPCDTRIEVKVRRQPELLEADVVEISVRELSAVAAASTVRSALEVAAEIDRQFSE